jgi:hypothetical protein
MSATHDSDYKLLFPHPEMVRDLLRNWAPGEWIAEADFSTLEYVNGSYVSEDQKQRHDDNLRRNIRGRDIYLHERYCRIPDDSIQSSRWPLFFCA